MSHPVDSAADAKSAAAHISAAEFRQLLQNLNPMANGLGIEVLEIGHGHARLRLPANPALERAGGIVAGPMLMGLADIALYAAVVGATGRTDAVTASMTLHFLRKAPSGAIVAEASLLKLGRTPVGEALLRSEAGGEAVTKVVSSWGFPQRG